MGGLAHTIERGQCLVFRQWFDLSERVCTEVAFDPAYRGDGIGKTPHASNEMGFSCGLQPLHVNGLMRLRATTRTTTTTTTTTPPQVLLLYREL
jgi:hypothetical protein